MFINNFDPVAFQIMSFEIRWYSLAYILGIIIGWILCKKIFIKNLDINQKFDDYITYLIIGIIIGGRLGYVLFYNFNYYINNIVDIFKIWQGGMSFHGAFIGIVVAAVRLKDQIKKSFLEITDIIVIYVPIGLFFGRVGNFINSELYGIPTNGSWGVVFPLVDELPRHPSMLYEAFLEGIIIFIILLILSKRKNLNHGILTSSFLIFYSIFRFVVEFVRVPDMHIGYIWNDWLTMGQILTTPMMFIGLIILFMSERRQRA